MHALGKVLALAVVALGSTTTAFALQGVEGKDYATRTITVKNGVKVNVTATNYSVTTDKANSSRVVLSGNGKLLADSGEIENERASVTKMIEADGTYRLEAVCSNHHARQESCSITVEKVGGDIFE